MNLLNGMVFAMILHGRS